MLNAHLTYDAQRALAFTFPTSYLDAAKTTILKIGKPNYRFSENRIRLPLQKKFLDKTKHPWNSSTDRLRGASSGRFFTLI